MGIGPIGQAARDGDYDEVLRQALIKVGDTMDGTDSGRDIGALAIKVVELVDRCEARGGDMPNAKKAAAEVTAFAAISKRRPERRKAATG